MIFDLLLSFAMLVVMRIAMIVTYNLIRERSGKQQHNVERILIYGTGDKSVAVITRLAASPHYKVAGFLSYGNKLQDYKISESPVYNFKDLKSIEKLKENYRINDVLFAIENDVQSE